MTKKLVHVSVTHKNAIYVNDTRITNRSTKWGIHTSVDSFDCIKADVREKCMNRGHLIAVNNIDNKDY